MLREGSFLFTSRLLVFVEGGRWRALPVWQMAKLAVFPGPTRALSAMVARCRTIQTPDEKNFIFRDGTIALGARDANIRGILTIGTIALHRLPAYWPNTNLLSTSIGPLALRA
jgi:hypothetical protein